MALAESLRLPKNEEMYFQMIAIYLIKIATTFKTMEEVDILQCV